MARTAKRKGGDYRGVLYIRGLPADLKDRFKAHCAQRGVTLTEMIHTLIAEAIAVEDRAHRNQRVY